MAPLLRQGMVPAEIAVIHIETPTVKRFTLTVCFREAAARAGVAP